MGEATNYAGVDLTRHPALKEAYRIACLIEACGASLELTTASCAAFDFIVTLDRALRAAQSGTAPAQVSGTAEAGLPEPPPVVGDEVEWRGHRGKVLAVAVVHVKFEKGHTHFLHAKDLRPLTKRATHCNCPPSAADPTKPNCQGTDAAFPALCRAEMDLPPEPLPATKNEPCDRSGFLAEQIERSRRNIEGWPPDVKAAMGIADETTAPPAIRVWDCIGCDKFFVELPDTYCDLCKKRRAQSEGASR